MEVSIKGYAWHKKAEPRGEPDPTLCSMLRLEIRKRGSMALA